TSPTGTRPPRTEAAPMKLSTDRILTTHTGSLPRAQDLTTTLEALDAGTMPERAVFETRVRRAVGDIVRQQIDAGVDIVNDGEQGKVGYSTYVRHRLIGFDGKAAGPVRADWADFPEAGAGRGERGGLDDIAAVVQRPDRVAGPGGGPEGRRQFQDRSRLGQAGRRVHDGGPAPGRCGLHEEEGPP